MSNVLRNFFRFVLLVLLQVFVLNRILLHEFINPYIYLLFILLLPFNTPRLLTLLLGLLLGLTLDSFMNTPGMHAAACVLIAFLRPYVLRIFITREEWAGTRKSPSISTMGFRPFLVYALILVLAHHTLYFVLEVYGFNSPWYLLGKILGSAAVTLGLILLYELLVFRKK